MPGNFGSSIADYIIELLNKKPPTPMSGMVPAAPVPKPAGAPLLGPYNPANQPFPGVNTNPKWPQKPYSIMGDVPSPAPTAVSPPAGMVSQGRPPPTPTPPAAAPLPQQRNQGIDPSLLQLGAAMNGLGSADDRIGDMANQEAIANQLRGATLHDMRGNGRVTVAASPLEVIGTLAQNYVGKKMLGDIVAKKAGIRDKQDAARADVQAKLADILRRMNGDSSGPRSPFSEADYIG